jgi:hypothetical protein
LRHDLSSASLALTPLSLPALARLTIRLAGLLLRTGLCRLSLALFGLNLRSRRLYLLLSLWLNLLSQCYCGS